MPQISTSQLEINKPIEAAAPDSSLVITIDAARPLKVGSYTFQLEVVDDSGNKSQPVLARLVVLDDQLPTAIITAPRSVGFGRGFTLSGKESTDTGGGTIAKFIWTLVQ